MTKRKKPIFSCRLFLMIFTMLCVGLLIWKKINAPGIFLVEPLFIEYGQTQISGTLSKDVPLNVEGNFLLVLSDSRIVLLDVANLDHLINHEVTLEGFLIPPLNQGEPMKMMVEKITAKK